MAMLGLDSVDACMGARGRHEGRRRFRSGSGFGVLTWAWRGVGGDLACGVGE